MKISSTDTFQKISQEKRDTVFQAAVREFASNGYNKASMNVISKTAGIAKGSLFQYFVNKSGLFQAVVDYTANQVRDYLRAARVDTIGWDFYARLEHIMRQGFMFIENHPRLAKIYFNLLQSDDVPDGAEWISSLNLQSRKFLQKLIEEGIGLEEVSPEIDVERISYLINLLLEDLLRAYFSKHIAQNLGLFQADISEREIWIATLVNLVKFGISNPVHAETP